MIVTQWKKKRKPHQCIDEAIEEFSERFVLYLLLTKRLSVQNVRLIIPPEYSRNRSVYRPV